MNLMNSRITQYIILVNEYDDDDENYLWRTQRTQPRKRSAETRM